MSLSFAEIFSGHNLAIETEYNCTLRPYVHEFMEYTWETCSFCYSMEIPEHTNNVNKWNTKSEQFTASHKWQLLIYQIDKSQLWTVTSTETGWHCWHISSKYIYQAIDIALTYWYYIVFSMYTTRTCYRCMTSYPFKTIHSEANSIHTTDCVSDSTRNTFNALLNYYD